MTKAEERALEVFPEDIQLFAESQEEPGKWLPVDENAQLRYGYKRGYEQAERDILSTIESRLSEIIGDAQPKPALRAELEELIKRIKNE